MPIKKKDISPEERLLDLIRNKRAEPEESLPPQAAGRMPEKAPEKPSDPAPGITRESASFERISGILKSEVFKSKVFEPAMLKRVNRYLIMAFGVLLLYFLADIAFVRPYKNVQSLVAKGGTGSAEKISPAEMKDVAVVKDYSSYSSAVSGRAVFGSSALGAGGAEDVTASGGMTDRIGLVGVITGDNPQAIIEDKKLQKTYYLNKGQSFEGHVVEEILEDKVILDYEGKKVSLFL